MRSRPAGRRSTIIAWAVILSLVIFKLALPLLIKTDDQTSPLEDPMGAVTMRLQGRVLVAAGQLSSDEQVETQLARQVEVLDGGSIPQRLRYAVIVGELVGRDAALEALDDLQEAIQSARTEPAASEALKALPPEVVEVQQILREIYRSDLSEEVVLTEAQRDLLVEELDWFGELALYPPWTGDRMERTEVIAPAVRAMFILVGVVVLLMLAGAAGFIGLVICLVLAFVGHLRDGMELSGGRHGLYAETFAMWLLLFFALQLLAAAFSTAFSTPPLDLFPALIAFFASLVVLAWPVIRGLSWRQVRRDIGWTMGREPVVEPLLGFGGYAMTLPLLAVGVIAVMVLMEIDAFFAPKRGILDPLGGPAHPVVLDLAAGDPLMILQVLLLGSIAAPIVEETMFRGVLYRHLRGASASLGLAVSIVLSTFLNTLLFAVVHPQGWVAWPALMSLAVGFTLMREWRGTLLPSMLMHGISNGIVLTMVTVVLAD